MKYLNIFEDLYPGFTSSFSQEGDYRIGDEKFTLEELEDIFNNYRNEFSRNFDINKIKNKSKKDLGLDIYNKLNLKTFFKSFKTIISNDESLEYFDNYIRTLPRRYRKVFKNDHSNYEYPEFKKVKKIESELKNKKSYDLLKIESPALYAELTKMIMWMKNNEKKILITFDGRDTGGKGSISRFILKNFFAAPLGRYMIYKDFGIPTKWEQRNWFFRYKRALPKNGQLVLMDRSWYNRAVNDPVMGYCTNRQYENFMRNVLKFEDDIRNNGIIHIKFWLSIEKETQMVRFNSRKISPIKYWKFSDNDLKSIEKWDEFTLYINEMFKRTGTKKFPWVVVNMDDKPLGWLNALRYILNQVPYDNKNDNILEIYPEVVYEIKNK